MSNNNDTITTPTCFYFDFHHRKRYTYTIHPDDPGFREEMLTYSPISDYDPYDICTPYLEWNESGEDTNDEINEHLYHYYENEIRKSIITYQSEKASIAEHFGLPNQYQCSEGCRMSFEIPEHCTVKVYPKADFADIIEEILINRPYETQRKIADNIHVSESTFSRWMTQENYYPSLKQLILICIYLKLTYNEGLTLFQTTPYAPGNHDLVQQTFRGLLEANAFKTSKRIGNGGFRKDVHQLLQYALSLAAISGERFPKEAITQYFYDPKNPDTEEFILPESVVEKTQKEPSCEILESKFDELGPVRIVAFGKRSNRKMIIK